MHIWPGHPYPLGASFDGTGTTFAVFSEVATRVELCLFDERGNESRLNLPETHAFIWHGYVPNLQPGTRYGFRVHGPFDPERGVRLVSFALHWIRAEMHEYILRNWRLVKLATTKAQRKLFFNLRSMKGGMGALTYKEADYIARELGVKTEEVFEMEMRLGGSDVALDPTPGDEESVTPIAYLTDSEDEPVQILERAETARNRSVGLQRAMAKLDDRSRRIIEARWLKEEDPATLQELADEYGVSAERIRQIESKAIKTMRGQMAAA